MENTCRGNLRCSSVCLLGRIEWNNRGQPKSPPRRRNRAARYIQLPSLGPGNKNDVLVDTYSFGLVVDCDNPIDQ
jgi:hypothetical protein